MEPFVSVIVPTWNRASMLADTLRSLLAQDYEAGSREIVVVDDGSTDGTQGVVESFGPNLRYVRVAHAGLNAARNTGFAESTGDPICFVDDDVDAPPGWLRELVAGALRHPEAGCVGGPVRLRLEGPIPRLCAQDVLGETEFDLGVDDRLDTIVLGGNAAVRRRAVEAVGGFNERLMSGYADETEWQERVIAAGYPVAYVGRAWLWHRRLERDLRLRTLIRKSIRRGYLSAEYSRITGTRFPPVRRKLALLVRSLAHSARHRCAGGLLTASHQVGYLAGLIRRVRST